MWLWTIRPPWRFQCMIHKAWLFGPLFNQKVIHTTWCCGNHFYHWAHIRAYGDLAHGAWDPDFVAQMSLYALRMLQVLKDYIWTQLKLGYTVKQIDKHKTIWWAWVNVGEPMTKDDLLGLQNIVYLDWKHKKDSWCLHRNLTIFIQSCVCVHLDDVFYFQDASEVNEI
jgi:hypothetical protein